VLTRVSMWRRKLSLFIVIVASTSIPSALFAGDGEEQPPSMPSEVDAEILNLGHMIDLPNRGRVFYARATDGVSGAITFLFEIGDRKFRLLDTAPWNMLYARLLVTD